jgi:beta-phosphoglucomutase-like phosphatase (HAD superfamily)
MPVVLRALVFDFNGVLVNDEPLHLQLFQRVLKEEGISLTSADYYDRYLGFDDRGCFSAALGDAGQEASSTRIARLVARKAAYYQEAVRRDGFPFFPGAVELVLEAGASLPLVLVSGALREEVEGALRQAGIERAFRRLITAEDVERGKPDPEGYALAIAALNSEPPLPTRLIHPHECAAIEDSPAGIEAAAAAGLRTLGVAQTYTADALDAADAVVPRLAGLSLDDLLSRFAD